MAKYVRGGKKGASGGSAELLVFGLLGALIMVLALPLVSSANGSRGGPIAATTLAREGVSR